jgi:hypothetical protein
MDPDELRCELAREIETNQDRLAQRWVIWFDSKNGAICLPYPIANLPITCRSYF